MLGERTGRRQAADPPIDLPPIYVPVIQIKITETASDRIISRDTFQTPKTDLASICDVLRVAENVATLY